MCVCGCVYKEVCDCDNNTTREHQYRKRKIERDGDKFGGIKRIYHSYNEFIYINIQGRVYAIAVARGHVVHIFKYKKKYNH